MPIYNPHNWHRDVLSALHSANKCVFFPAAVEIWYSENSKVTSLPYFDLTKLLDQENYRFTSTSLVEISGPSCEPLHYHLSDVIGVVTAGEGILRHRWLEDSNNEEQQQRVQAGDVAVIPKGVMHLFHTEEKGCLNYIAFEISVAQIDYQKHWTERL